MKLLREDFPFMAGWLAYLACMALTHEFLLQETSVSYIKSSFLSFPLAAWSYILLLICVYVLVGYLSFSASIHWIVVPILNRIKGSVVEPKWKSLFVRWIVLNFCIAIFNSFTLFLDSFPIPIEIKLVVTLMWRIAVSVFSYGTIVLDYVTNYSKKIICVSESDLATR